MGTITKMAAFADLPRGMVDPALDIKATSIQSLYRVNERWVRSSWAKWKTIWSDKRHQQESIPCFCLDGAAQAIYLRETSMKATKKYLSVLKKLWSAIQQLDPVGAQDVEKRFIDEASGSQYTCQTHIIAWNDSANRTVREVRAVVKLAGV